MNCASPRGGEPMDVERGASDDLVLDDYHELVSSEPRPALFSPDDPEAQAKNRFTNVWPVASTRVRLQHRRLDYINANKVALHGREYICTQGPLMESTNDFWLMAYQQDSRCIVMLCNLVEKNRVRCHKYWPKNGETRRYGSVSVTMLKAVTLPGVHLRKLRLTDSAGNNERVITQVHFTEWPDFGVPDSTDGMRSVLNVFDHYLANGGGPPIVHCSAGIGRTGAFVAIHSSLWQLRTTGLCNVRETVKSLRQQRAGSIQTAEQYLFVYTTLRETLFSLENPQLQQLLESSGEADENMFVNESLMTGRSFNCLANEAAEGGAGSDLVGAEERMAVLPPSPFLMGH